jgi:murein L,D-transpeptidase YcbB/YkuD
MPLKQRLLVVGALLACLGRAAPTPAQSLSDQVAGMLRERLETVGVPPQLVVGRELIWASDELPAFYQRRVFRPAWSDDAGPLPRVDELVAAIRQADADGLRPEDYHLRNVRVVIAEMRRNRAQGNPPDAAQLADLDLLLTDAFLIYGSHLLHGRVNPETIHSEWKANRRGADLGAVLEDALKSRGVSVALQHLAPPQPGYARLRAARARYQRIVEMGGWPTLPDGVTWSRGSRDPGVRLLRRRLQITGDLSTAAGAGGEVFDRPVEAGVRRFQARHGLAATGKLDSATVAALDVPAVARLAQIELNLERWRWLPQNLGRRYLLVNIAAFELRVVEGARPRLTMRVMVGKPYRRTPVFSDTLRYLVLSPSWNIPKSLALEDELPLIKRNPRYLARQHITMLDGWGANAQTLDPAKIDWSQVTPQHFRYRLRQEPGPWNGLGRVKFMFPNPYDVYLHDTPARELFDRPDRDFSSGCIRIERPLDLAAYLLADAPGGRQQRIEAVIAPRQETIVPAPEPIPVHVEYWTTWVADNGAVQFRRDVYGRDPELAAALGSPAPVPAL